MTDGDFCESHYPRNLTVEVVLPQGTINSRSCRPRAWPPTEHRSGDTPGDFCPVFRRCGVSHIFMSKWLPV